MKQHDGKDDETGVRIDPSKVFVSGVCSLNVHVCVCVCSDTPQGERVCHDNKKKHTKKNPIAIPQLKKLSFCMCIFG